jgi:hypothetical protein
METESENIRVNGAMVRNLLEALAQKISTTRSFSYGIETLSSHLKLTKEGFYLKPS